MISTVSCAYASPAVADLANTMTRAATLPSSGTYWAALETASAIDDDSCLLGLALSVYLRGDVSTRRQ